MLLGGLIGINDSWINAKGNISNFNDIYTSGIYYFFGGNINDVNGPSNAYNYGILISFMASNKAIIHFYVPILYSSSKYEFYIRSMNENREWQGWRKIVTSNID